MFSGNGNQRLGERRIPPTLRSRRVPDSSHAIRLCFRNAESRMSSHDRASTSLLAEPGEELQTVPENGEAGKGNSYELAPRVAALAIFEIHTRYLLVARSYS